MSKYKNKDLKQLLITFLTNYSKGKEKSISMERLSYIHNTTTRQIRSVIEDIRTNDIPLNGYFLVSHNEGYWLTKDEEETEQWLHRYLGTAKTQFKVAKSTIKQLNRERQSKIQSQFNFE